MWEILCRAILSYGIDMQRAVAIEEMSELTKELIKDKRGIGDVSHIAEEIADVTIMLEQLKLYYSIESEVEIYKQEKIKRLQKKLDEKK